MVKPTRPPANGFVAAVRHIYNPIGFSKGYNFILFFISMGYLVGFTLSRLEYFSFYGVFCNPNAAGGSSAAPGECYYYSQDLYKIGIMLHIFCILPAGILVVFQFVPAIRHKLIIFHRINGYIIIILSTIASAGAIIIAPHAFGGDLSTQTWTGAMVISTTVAYIMAYINIKRLQIDQHRAWMMRAWAYFATIITIRIIMISTASIVSNMPDFFQVRQCAQLNWLLGEDRTLQLYPECGPFFNAGQSHQVAAVKANFNSEENPIEIGVSLGIGFGSAGWISLWMHAIIIEVYLALTTAESERLREVSYQRQLERGFRNPGSAGLTGNLGDAPAYVPVSKRQWNSSMGEDVAMLPLTKRAQGDEES